MNKQEVIDYLANEYVHFYWVRKVNKQVARMLLIEELKKKGV